MKKAKFKVYALGCKVNQYDAGKLSSGLSSAGFQYVESDADFAIIYSCAVTGSAITKSRQAVRKAQKENPKAKIILSGCWPRTYRDEAESLEGVDLVLAKAGPKEVLMAARELYGFDFKDSRESCISQNSNRGGRYFIKVQDGCEQFCSYCVIPYARGPLTSRRSDEIMEEAKTAVAVGFPELVLSGIHLGLYGVEHVKKDDAESGMELYKLIEQLSSIDGLKRIRLSSIEITEVSDKLISLFKKNEKLCHHLHIPLQSGCDKVLKNMKRPYNTSFFEKRLKKIFKAVPDIAITTDVIVGFPGETDVDFSVTESFCSRVGFSRLHVFPFSAHPLTPAFSMSGAVKEEKKKERASKLRKLSSKLENQYRRKFVGREMEVLVESFSNKEFKGITSNYLEVSFPASSIISANKNKKNLIGQMVSIVIK